MRLSVAMTAAIAVFVCCASFATRTAQANVVTMHVFDFDFGLTTSEHDDPTINLNDTIHWVWNSGNHSVTSVAGSIEVFNSHDHTPSFTFDHTFTNPGTFYYFCDIHGFDLLNGTAGGMAGHITVLPAPGPSAAAGLAAIGLLARRPRRSVRLGA